MMHLPVMNRKYDYIVPTVFFIILFGVAAAFMLLLDRDHEKNLRTTTILT